MSPLGVGAAAGQNTAALAAGSAGEGVEED
jgi:hypothetical protein